MLAHSDASRSVWLHQAASAGPQQQQHPGGELTWDLLSRSKFILPQVRERSSTGAIITAIVLGGFHQGRLHQRH